MVTNLRQLTLGVDCATFDGLVKRQEGKGQQLFDQLSVVVSAASRVTGFEKKRQASRHATLFYGNGDLLGAHIGERCVREPGPS